MLLSFSRHTYLSLSRQKTGQCWVLQESSSDIPHQVEWSAYYAGGGERRKDNRRMGEGKGRRVWGES